MRCYGRGGGGGSRQNNGYYGGSSFSRKQRFHGHAFYLARSFPCCNDCVLPPIHQGGPLGLNAPPFLAFLNMSGDWPPP